MLKIWRFEFTSPFCSAILQLSINKRRLHGEVALEIRSQFGETFVCRVGVLRGRLEKVVSLIIVLLNPFPVSRRDFAAVSRPLQRFGARQRAEKNIRDLLLVFCPCIEVLNQVAALSHNNCELMNYGQNGNRPAKVNCRCQGRFGNHELDYAGYDFSLPQAFVEIRRMGINLAVHASFLGDWKDRRRLWFEH